MSSFTETDETTKTYTKFPPINQIHNSVHRRLAKTSMLWTVQDKNNCFLTLVSSSAIHSNVTTLLFKNIQCQFYSNPHTHVLKTAFLSLYIVTHIKLTKAKVEKKSYQLSIIFLYNCFNARFLLCNKVFDKIYTSHFPQLCDFYYLFFFSSIICRNS